MKVLVIIIMVCMSISAVHATRDNPTVRSYATFSLEVPKNYGGVPMPLLHYQRGKKLLAYGKITRARRQFHLAAAQSDDPEISICATRILTRLKYPTLDSDMRQHSTE